MNKSHKTQCNLVDDANSLGYYAMGILVSRDEKVDFESMINILDETFLPDFCPAKCVKSSKCLQYYFLNPECEFCLEKCMMTCKYRLFLQSYANESLSFFACHKCGQMCMNDKDSYDDDEQQTYENILKIFTRASQQNLTCVCHE